jgi:hypothetical protein
MPKACSGKGIDKDEELKGCVRQRSLWKRSRGQMGVACLDGTFWALDFILGGLWRASVGGGVVT